MRSSARRMLQAALEREADDYVNAHAHLRNEQVHRVVERNGHHPQREVLTGAGPLAIQRPHIRDPREGHTFTSAILPRYMRRSPSLADRRSADALIPALYLRGVSTNDFALALEAILGPQAGNLSPSCAVERRFFLVGANPTQYLSFQLVAAKAIHGGNDMD